jgi:hypothetical protein
MFTHQLSFFSLATLDRRTTGWLFMLCPMEKKMTLGSTLQNASDHFWTRILKKRGSVKAFTVLLISKHIPAAVFVNQTFRCIRFMPAGFISIFNHCEPVR